MQPAHVQYELLWVCILACFIPRMHFPQVLTVRELHMICLRERGALLSGFSHNSGSVHNAVRTLLLCNLKPASLSADGEKAKQGRIEMEKGEGVRATGFEVG